MKPKKASRELEQDVFQAPNLLLNFPTTSSWLASSPLPPLENVGAVAERLVLLAHYGADFTIWGTPARRVTYWESLTDRIKAGTFAGPTLADWWESVSKNLISSPRNRSEREELAKLLSSGLDRSVLKEFRSRPGIYVLRARVVAEHRSEAFKNSIEVEMAKREEAETETAEILSSEIVIEEDGE